MKAKFSWDWILKTICPGSGFYCTITACIRPQRVPSPHRLRESRVLILGVGSFPNSASFSAVNRYSENSGTVMLRGEIQGNIQIPPRLPGDLWLIVITVFPAGSLGFISLTTVWKTDLFFSVCVCGGGGGGGDKTSDNGTTMSGQGWNDQRGRGRDDGQLSLPFSHSRMVREPSSWK